MLVGLSSKHHLPRRPSTATHPLASCCRVNMGVADELCLDVLINSLANFSTE